MQTPHRNPIAQLRTISPARQICNLQPHVLRGCTTRHMPKESVCDTAAPPKWSFSEQRITAKLPRLSLLTTWGNLSLSRCHVSGVWTRVSSVVDACFLFIYFVGNFKQEPKPRIYLLGEQCEIFSRIANPKISLSCTPMRTVLLW